MIASQKPIQDGIKGNTSKARAASNKSIKIKGKANLDYNDQTCQVH